MAFPDLNPTLMAFPDLSQISVNSSDLNPISIPDRVHWVSHLEVQVGGDPTPVQVIFI